MANLQEKVSIQNEMLASGLFYNLARDLVTGEIDVHFVPMLPTDAEELDEYNKAIDHEFGELDEGFVKEVVGLAIARFKSCRRHNRDYWGRPTDPLYLY